jgi:hypothetical protein
MAKYGLLKLEIIKTLSSSVLAKAYDLKVNEYSFMYLHFKGNTETQHMQYV